ncbi:MAG: DUF2807 domain-containing protein [Microscillaceae bacterium]|jgi:hypothetical protein|nr:DUF2807 domain-containing protein [Microscillaceae bacterium]
MKRINVYLKLSAVLLYLLLLPMAIFAQSVLNIRRNVASFNQIKASSIVNVYIQQGEKEDLRVETREDLHKFVKTEVNQNELLITTENFPKNWNWREENNIYIKVYVTVRDLQKIEASGSSDIFFDNQLITKRLELHLHGSSDARVNIKCYTLICNIHGSSDAVINGSAEELNAKIHGSSDLKAYNLQVNNCEIQVSGSGDAFISVNGELAATVSGSGDLHYQGNPNIRKMVVSGSGDAHRKN